MTVNERFILQGGYIGLAEWILGRHNQKWMGIVTREVMETAKSYTAAQKSLSSVPLIAPIYFILAGNKSHQVCSKVIITGFPIKRLIIENCVVLKWILMYFAHMYI